MRTLLAAVLAALLTVASLTGCAGSSCDDLPALQAEREQRRAAYLELARSGAPVDETTRADEELHAFERRVFDAEQECAGRA